MHIPRAAIAAAALLGFGDRQPQKRQFEPDSSVYKDPDTGLTFASYAADRGMIFRVALPDKIPEDLVYDAVLQMIAPVDIGWVGWAWAGTMTYNPLAIAWQNGDEIVLSSRIAYGYYAPPAYPAATYTVLKSATYVNATHWQLTAKCSGCSRWGDEDIGYQGIDPTYEATFAYAYTEPEHPVERPDDPTSPFGVHDSLGHPRYDLTVARNADFEQKVAQKDEDPAEPPKPDDDACDA